MCSAFLVEINRYYQTILTKLSNIWNLLIDIVLSVLSLHVCSYLIWKTKYYNRRDDFFKYWGAYLSHPPLNKIIPLDALVLIWASKNPSGSLVHRANFKYAELDLNVIGSRRQWNILEHPCTQKFKVIFVLQHKILTKLHTPKQYLPPHYEHFFHQVYHE